MSAPVAKWVFDQLDARDDLTCEIVDLEYWDFPQFALSRPPAMGDYQDRRQRAWARTVARGDAFLFVGPEYNHGYSGVLKTALDYLMAEWQDKPAACVTFGNVGGARMVENLQPVWIELGMIPSAPSVHLMGAHGKRDGASYRGDERDHRALDRTVKQLLHWTHRAPSADAHQGASGCPRILVLGLGADAIRSVVGPLRANGWLADGMTVPKALAGPPDAGEFDIISFGRGALGKDADQLKSLFRTANPAVQLIETFLPIAVRQIEAARDVWAGEEQSLRGADVSRAGDPLVVTADLATEARLGVTAYTIEGASTSLNIATINSPAGNVELRVAAPAMPLSGVIVDLDGTEFAHIPFL